MHVAKITGNKIDDASCIPLVNLSLSQACETFTKKGRSAQRKADCPSGLAQLYAKAADLNNIQTYAHPDCDTEALTGEMLLWEEIMRLACGLLKNPDLENA